MAKLAIADDLTKRLDGLRQNRTTVSRQEITHAVEEVISSLTGAMSMSDIKLYRELEDLARFIQSAKREIAALRPHDIQDEHIPMATDELDAVIAATAQATGEILDRAEALNSLASTLPPAAAAEITDAVTRIFEASNFQDITGQRITKVVKALKYIETKIDSLVATFGTRELEVPPAPVDEPQGDAKLLHGPQMPTVANSQAEIDAILAELF
ncbi:MAG: chemotaxis protein CheZ [Aliidongia sp.]|jgi:chemotaxis protein CheZ|nr:chemotaxis protein CheZ [Aliidongia sp.]